jgi:hypothetical protein
MAKMTERERFLARVIALHALVGSDNAGEREAARTKLVELLAKNKATWNDLPVLIAEAKAAELRAAKDPYDDPPAGAAPPNVNVLDCLRAVLGDYISVEAHELTAIVLWILHCHVYRRFMVTPRLALTSPVKGCGKTTLLSIIEHLVLTRHRTDSITPAAIYRLIDREHPTLLVDEADNAGLLVNGLLRAIFNPGTVGAASARSSPGKGCRPSRPSHRWRSRRSANCRCR